MAIEDAIELTERDRQIRDNQLKLQWEMKSPKRLKQAFCVAKDRGHSVTRSASLFSISALEQKDDVF